MEYLVRQIILVTTICHYFVGVMSFIQQQPQQQQLTGSIFDQSVATISTILHMSTFDDDNDDDFTSFSVIPGQQRQRQQQEEEGTNIVEYNDFLPNPNTDWSAQDVVQGCMDTLIHDPIQGLEVCFAFSSDRCRSAIGGSLDKFNEYANNPVFQYLVHCDEYKIVRVGPIITSTPTRGAMQTCLIEAIHKVQQQQSTDDENNNENSEITTSSSRKFLWTLQQERRPPNQGCWMVHEVLFVNNAYMQTI
jgi:hypothetical protein